jgi:hypothetical protein
LSVIGRFFLFFAIDLMRRVPIMTPPFRLGHVASCDQPGRAAAQVADEDRSIPPLFRSSEYHVDIFFPTSKDGAIRVNRIFDFTNRHAVSRPDVEVVFLGGKQQVYSHVLLSV